MKRTAFRAENRFPRLYGDASAFLPGCALDFSWKSASAGLTLHRFRLNQETEGHYAYDNHMLALPLRGEGWIDWKCDHRAGLERIVPGRVTIEPAHRFWHQCRWKEMVCLTAHLEAGALARAVHEDFDADGVELRSAVNANDPLLAYLLRLLAREAEAPQPRTLHAEALAARIAALLLEGHTARPRRVRHAAGGLSRARLDGVRRWIEEHLPEKISLADLAAAAGGMSAYHFSRLFTKSLGLTPHQFVLEQRVARAVELLKSGAMNAGQAAAESGFSDQSHLTNVLRARLGRTPADLSQKRARFFKHALAA